MAGPDYHIVSLADVGWTDEIPEPHDSLQANAREKSATVSAAIGKACFGEDTGLEVAALDGAPGVYSARYAGPQKRAADNMALLLQRMQGQSNRKARFRTVISFVDQQREWQFEGICAGRLTEAPRGGEGFGYDPVFIPEGADKTFAEMSREEKRRYSHRAQAFDRFMAFLATYGKDNS